MSDRREQKEAERSARVERVREELRVGRVEQLNSETDHTDPTAIQAAMANRAMQSQPQPDILNQVLEDLNQLLNEALGHFAAGDMEAGINAVEEVRDSVYSRLR